MELNTAYFIEEKYFETVFEWWNLIHVAQCVFDTEWTHVSGQEILHLISLHLLLRHGDSMNIDISQGSVATWLRRGGIFKYFVIAIFTAESNSERILKISKHLAKLRIRQWCPVWLREYIIFKR